MSDERPIRKMAMQVFRWWNLRRQDGDPHTDKDMKAAIEKRWPDMDTSDVQAVFSSFKHLVSR